MANGRVTGTYGDRNDSTRNGLPERKPYVYRGGEQEPPEVTAARERHRVLNAEIEQARAVLDARMEALAKTACEARERDG